MSVRAPQPAAPSTPAPACELLARVEAHAANAPHAAALLADQVDGLDPIRISYAQLESAVDRATAFLADRFEPGTVIAISLPNGHELVTWVLAALAAGVRALLVHPGSAAAECRDLARRAGASAVIAANNTAEGWGLPWVQPTPPVRPATRPHRSGGAVILPSSGTTGQPKLAVRPAAALDADARQVADGLGLNASDRAVAAMPLCHSYGIDILVGTLHVGATLRVLTGFDAAAVAAEFAGGATVFPGVPYMYEALARELPRGPARPRVALSAGAALAPRVRNSFRAAWGLDITQLYGATELGTVAIGDPGVGRPLPGVSVRIIGEEGGEGEVAVRAPSMMSGYLHADAPLVDGHFRTGDLGRLDADGRLHITGRLKLLIDVGGFKVNPIEVESVLAAHPGVAECMVTPMAQSDTVTRLRALYVPAGGVETPTRELRDYLRERLSPHKLPRVVEAVASLPRTPTGKFIRPLPETP